jgi:hypothetical protein
MLLALSQDHLSSKKWKCPCEIHVSVSLTWPMQDVYTRIVQCSVGKVLRLKGAVSINMVPKVLLRRDDQNVDPVKIKRLYAVRS